MHRPQQRAFAVADRASFPLFQVDAFSAEPLRGNPAAVALLPATRALDDERMRLIAAENNLSETAFVTPLSEAEGDGFERGTRFSLRWFTPTTEVKLCGHATLATAAALFSPAVGNANAALHFETLSGTLTASRGSGDSSWIALDFPGNPPRPVDDADAELRELAEAVLEGSSLSSAPMACFLSQTTRKLVIKSSAAVAELASLRPPFAKLLALHNGSRVTGVSVTAAGGPAEHFDFSSRYFAPWNGINEDPVNGSSHTVLAPLWGELLGKRRLRAWQASQRGGELLLQLQDDGRVKLEGQAVVVIEGRMFC